MNRAQRLERFALLTTVCCAAWLPTRAADNSVPLAGFTTRGVVLVPEDLSLADWPERAAKAGLTTIALHHGASPKAVVDFVASPAGSNFLAQCARLGLHVEYELHAMSELLPRALFTNEPALFRMNDQGQRTPDANLCAHSPRALEIVSSNALRLARHLKPTTGRYFFWGDDGRPWCRCPQCREFSDSDQALLLENHLVGELRKLDPRAQLAHLAYANTLTPPKRVEPVPGVFLEFAPIHRRYDMPYAAQSGPEAKDALKLLEENLRVFPAETAQALEYWLDVSRFSKWKRPAAKLPWRRDVLEADAETYARLGIRHLTTFAVWIDADYVKRFGELTAIQEYGDTLRSVEEPVHANSLSAWRSPTGEWQTVRDVRLNPTNDTRFALLAGEGALVNGAQGRTVDLLTKAEFGDVEVHVEFCIARRSNSGVYLMGRYEVQIYDSHGGAKDKYPGIECGGIYPRWTAQRGEYEGHSPRVNASQPAGAWQSFDILFRAPRFDAAGKKTSKARFEKVVHNGQVVHENVELTGPTRAARWESEASLGPLLLQGDHGPVAFRNMKIRRLSAR